MEAPDSNIKIILLIFFSAYFELIGALTRRYLTQDLEKDRYDEYHAKFRSLEICLSSMLSSLTLNIKIHKHQSFSLIIIVICLLIVFILDFITEEKIHFLKNIGSVFISSICRVYLDTIEKYLFEVDFVELYKLMAFESIFNFIFISLLYFFEKPRKEFENLCNTDFLKIFFIFFLLIVYSIFTWFKNVYRRFTIKFYSPMTRALAESAIDPILIGYGKYKGDYEIFPFIITISCSIIMIFCSCIYNEIFILYCCGLERETYHEITSRSYTLEMINEYKEEKEEDERDSIS